MRARSPSSATSAASADACASRSSASAQRVAATAARARRRCASARRCAHAPRPLPSRARSDSPTSTARSRLPASASTVARHSSMSTTTASPRRAPAPAPARASPRRSSSAPPSSARRPASSSSAAARLRSPAPSATSAASSHQSPGSPGCALLDGRPAPVPRAGHARAEGARPAPRRATARGGSGRRRRRIDRHDLRVDRGMERGHDRTLVQPRDRRQQVPVEAAARGRPPRASTVRASSPSAASRRRTLSANVSGTTWSTAPDNVHDVPLWTSAPDATATASSSSTRNGHALGPSGQSHQLGRRSSVPRHDSSISATSASSRRRSSISSDARRACSARARSRPGEGLSSRTVATHDDVLGGEVVGQVLDDRERLGIGPVQILQDHQAAAGAGDAAQEAQHPLGQHEHGVVDLGNLVVAPVGDEPAQGRAERRELGCVRRVPARTAELSASASGRYATGVAVGTARPRRTRKPRCSASPAVTWASRDLPIPASPTRNTTPPRPCVAALTGHGARQARDPVRRRARRARIAAVPRPAPSSTPPWLSSRRTAANRPVLRSGAPVPRRAACRMAIPKGT